MKKLPIPDQSVLHQLLDYDPDTGKLYWKTRDESLFVSRSAMLTWNKRFAGKEAFTPIGSDGYKRGTLNYKMFLAHRVIFKYLHGYDPDQVDHDDKDTLNNRAYNLIDATATTNSRNSKKYTSNSSGNVGVYLDTDRNKWIASITVNYKPIFLGRFDDKDDAIQARKAAELQYGFHANHGK
jgi:Ca2+-binding RTX toxin-like protein